MSREAFLEDYVVPICSFDNMDGTAQLTKFMGSAFFIDEKGTFLTARHVAEASTQVKDKACGLVVKDPLSSSSQIAPLSQLEHAPAPWDVTIGKVSMQSKCAFTWPKSSAIGPWLDVATFGYPDSAVIQTRDRLDIHLRNLKGYIVRNLRGHEYGFAINSAPSFELSFIVPTGVSGAPLFVSGANGQAELIGICIASMDTETCAYFLEETEENGNVFREKKVRVEQFGVANDLSQLSDWRPALLEGLSLKEHLSRSFDPTRR